MKRMASTLNDYRTELFDRLVKPTKARSDDEDGFTVDRVSDAELMARSPYRTCREKSGKSMGDLARELGVSVVHVSNVERGIEQPDDAIVSKWREAIGYAFTPADFGAKCDGVTDDSEAMQRFMSAAEKK